jgi:hypothetical protein
MCNFKNIVAKSDGITLKGAKLIYTGVCHLK